MQFPPVREGPQLHRQHFRTVAPQQTQARTGAPNQKAQQLKFVSQEQITQHVKQLFEESEQAPQQTN